MFTADILYKVEENKMLNKKIYICKEKNLCLGILTRLHKPACLAKVLLEDSFRETDWKDHTTLAAADQTAQNDV